MNWIWIHLSIYNRVVCKLSEFWNRKPDRKKDAKKGKRRITRLTVKPNWSLKKGKRRRKNTHKKTQWEKKNWNGQRRMNFWYFHVSEQKDSLIFTLHRSFDVLWFLFYFQTTSVFWLRPRFDDIDKWNKKKSKMDFLSRHSLINIKQPDTKDYLWILKKNREWKLVQCKEKHQQQMNETKKCKTNW